MLKVTIYSFAYKRGLPEDSTGNGGGFIFDCRGLPNPYKSEKYRNFSGDMPEITEFFKQNPIVDDFISKTLDVVEIPVRNYLDRNFENLQISFGCTGGQHRSVYAAEKVKTMLLEKYPEKVNIYISHREKKHWQLNY
jgi:UPF0042 nucleotide-binding protein